MDTDSELKVPLAKIRFEMMPIASAGLRSDRHISGRRRLLRQASSRRSSSACSSIVSRRRACARHHRVIKAEVAGRTNTIDERIATDPRAVLDRFQLKTLPALYDHVMALARGSRAEDAPFFGELTVDLTMSEPEIP